MYYINIIKAIKHRNKIYKNFKDLETKFLEDTDMLYTSSVSCCTYIVGVH